MKAVAALALLLALTACSGSDDTRADDGDEPAAAPPSSAPAPFVPDPSAPDDTGLDLATTDVCDLVREGIDQFNLGDLEATIEAFEDAIAPAEQLADDQPSDRTRTLLDAVRYYAALPADDYLEASQSSPEFLRFKDFTLTECAYTGPPGGATADPAIPA